MGTTQQSEIDQAALWNGAAGRAWVDEQALLDRVFEPFEKLLVDAAVGSAARDVLDVGCGTGGVAIAVARALADGGRCTGIDISAPMIDAARSRAERLGAPADFVLGDAEHHAFVPGRFDLIISRFGVMFFDDPVRAFTNLRNASRTGAELRLAVWRGPAENPFMTTAERAAAPLLPQMPPRRPDGPGQFGFADPDRVTGILEAAGWSGIDIRPIDVPCRMPESDLFRYLTRLGPLGMVLPTLDQATRERVVERARLAFEPYIHGTEVRFDAACWMVSGQS